MPCTLTEPHFGAYLDDTLDPATARRVAGHVAGCGRCSLLLAEMRTVETTLSHARRLAPPRDLTASIMSEVRSIPTPGRVRSPLYAILGTYVGFAWLTIAGFAFLDGPSARAILAVLRGSAVDLGASFGGLSKATAHLLGREPGAVTLAMLVLLAIDVVAASGIVALYSFHRARRAGDAVKTS